MAHPTGKIAIALAENLEASRQWVAFQLSEDHDKAMRERFKAEKKSHHKKKLQGRSKAESKGPVAVKRSQEVLGMATEPPQGPAVVKHAATEPPANAVKPSNVVCPTESGDAKSVVTAALPETAGQLSASRVALPIEFPRQVVFGVDASKEYGPRESAVVALKLRKEVEDLKMELTAEVSKRMVAEQLLSIVQQDLAEQQLRVSMETTARVKVENELVFVKTDLKRTERLLQERDNSMEELRQELKMANSVVERMEEYSQAVKYSTGGVDHFLDMKLSAGRVSEAEKKLKVCQQELLHSQEEVQRLLDKMEELTQERCETVSHRVHSRLLKIADERADEAEKRVHELEAEVEFLRGQVEQAKQASSHDDTKPLSLFSSSLAVSRPLFSSPYSSSALLAVSAPHTSVPSLDSFKFVSPYQADEFEHGTTKIGSAVARLSVGMQTSEQRRGEGDLVPSHSTGLSAPSEGLEHGVEDDRIGQLGAGPSSDRLVGKHAGVEGAGGDRIKGVLESGSREGSRDEVLLPFGELPDLDQLGDGQNPAGEGGMKKDKNTVSILRVTRDSDDQDDDDDDSSDWGSSSDEGGTVPISLPQFEAQVPQVDGASENAMSERRRPPPIKPKPIHLQLWQASADMIYYETPSSFDKPPSQPGLRRFPSFPKPIGPRGRRLPARYQVLQAHELSVAVA